MEKGEDNRREISEEVSQGLAVYLFFIGYFRNAKVSLDAVMRSMHTHFQETSKVSLDAALSTQRKFLGVAHKFSALANEYREERSRNFIYTEARHLNRYVQNFKGKDEGLAEAMHKAAQAVFDSIGRDLEFFEYRYKILIDTLNLRSSRASQRLLLWLAILGGIVTTFQIIEIIPSLKKWFFPWYWPLIWR
jgi:hypothetical protein